MSLLDDFKKILERKKTASPQEQNQFMEQLKREKDLYELFKASGLSPTVSSIGETARVREGIATLIEKVNLIDLITKITEITTIKTLENLDLIDRITLVDTITNIGTISTIGKISEIAGTSATYKRKSDLTVNPASYDLWIPASGKKIRLKQVVVTMINNDTSNHQTFHLKWGDSEDCIHYGGVVKAGSAMFDSTNLVGCNIDGAVDQKLVLFVGATMRFNVVVFGEEI